MRGYNDFPIILEGISVNDDTLLEMYNTLLQQIEEKKMQYLSTSLPLFKNNYLHITMTRLAYEFTKEEFESVVEEMKRRGLYEN